MSASGDDLETIAARTGCGRFTVVRTRRLYREGGLAALHPVKPSGRPSRATPEYLEHMKRAVRTNPQTLGYAFANWSSARLAAHLEKVTGIGFSNDQLRRLLHRKRISVQRPKHTLQGKRNERNYRIARDDLRALKKKPWPEPPTSEPTVTPALPIW